MSEFKKSDDYRRKPDASLTIEELLDYMDRLHELLTIMDDTTEKDTQAYQQIKARITKFDEECVKSYKTGYKAGVVDENSRMMREKPRVSNVESLASIFHDIYQEEAKRQGNIRHKDKYKDLPENIKDFDRVLARYVLFNYKKPGVTKEFLHKYVGRVLTRDLLREIMGK